MREQYQKIKRCDKDIADIAHQIAYIKLNPFYDTCGTEEQRDEDLETCFDVMRITLSEKQSHLETMQIEITKELQKISEAQKVYTLLKT